jgi:hypothetical protein
MPKNEFGGRSHFLIPAYKQKESKDNEFSHLLNNYEGESISYLVNKDRHIPQAYSCKKLDRVQNH